MKFDYVVNPAYDGAIGEKDYYGARHYRSLGQVLTHMEKGRWLRKLLGSRRKVYVYPGVYEDLVIEDLDITCGDVEFDNCKFVNTTVDDQKGGASIAT